MKILRVSDTGLGFRSGQTVRSTKGTGSITGHKARVLSGMPTEITLKASLRTTNQMVTVCTLAQTALATKECGSTTFSTVKDQQAGLMALLTLGTTSRAKNTELGLTSGPREILTAGNGKTIK